MFSSEFGRLVFVASARRVASTKGSFLMVARPGVVVVVLVVAVVKRKRGSDGDSGTRDPSCRVARPVRGPGGRGPVPVI